MIKNRQKKSYFSSTLLLFVVFMVPDISLNAQVCKEFQDTDTHRIYTNLSEALKQPDAVFRLRLQKHRLKKIPSEIFTLTHLQELDLSRNKIEVIPDEISQLKDLRVLNMDKNRLHTITDSLGELSALRVLQLGGNAICHLPASLTTLSSLECLDLWKNEVGTFPEGMELLKEHLKMIDLRYNPFPAESVEQLKTSLPETQIFTTRTCACMGE